MEGAPGKNEAGGYVKEEKNEDEDRETIVDVDAEKPQSSKVKEVKESNMEDVVGKSEAKGDLKRKKIEELDEDEQQRLPAADDVEAEKTQGTMDESVEAKEAKRSEESAEFKSKSKCSKLQSLLFGSLQKFFKAQVGKTEAILFALKTCNNNQCRLVCSREGLLDGSLSFSSSSQSSSLGCVAQASPRKLYISKYFCLTSALQGLLQGTR